MIKAIYKSAGDNAAIAMNIHAFQQIKTKVENEFDIPYSGTHHKSKDANLDIQRIMKLLQEENILSSELPIANKHSDIKVVKNLFVEGMQRLMEGGWIKAFQDTCGGCCLDSLEAGLGQVEENLEFDIENFLISISEE